jgi:DNA-binding transcriptional LysR family regulator
VTRGAHTLGLTQSAASSAIAALEARYSTRLFNRVGRRVELTEAGRLFLDEAKAVLVRIATAEQVVNNLAGLARGTLRLCASQTIANYWLPRLMHRCLREYPGIDLDLSIGNTAQVTRSVIDGSADFGLVEGEIDEPTLSQRVVAWDRLVLVVGKTHEWAQIERLEPSKLLTTAWVLRERGSGTRSSFEALLRRAGIQPEQLKVVLDFPSNEAVCAAVEDGAGATVISELVVGASIRSETLHQIALTIPQRPFYLLEHKERYRSHAHAAFLKLLCEAVPSQSPPET